MAEVVRLGGAEVDITGNLRPLSGDLKKAELQTDKAASRMAKSFDRFGRSVSRVSQEITGLRGAIAAAAIGLAVRQVVAAFAEFEKGLIGVGKTADLSGDDLQALGRGVQQLSREIPVATKELLAIAQAAGQLGIKGEKNLLAFVSTVGKLGGASDLAGEEAATALARILTVVGAPISDVDRLGAAIVALGNNFAATESEIAAVATRVARASAEFGVSAADVLGISTGLKAVGVEAEEGGTVIGKAFRQIKAAIRDGGKELANLEKITGLTRAELEATFAGNPTDALVVFTEALGRLNQQGGDVSVGLESIGLEGERVFAVFGTLAKRADVLRDALETSNAAYEENTALNQEAATAAQGFEQQMQLVRNAVNEAAVDLGAELAPIVKDLAVDFRDWIRAARDTGEIKELAEDVAGAFKFLANNLDLVTIAATTLAGSRIFSVFGPWGAAIGTAAGIVAGLAITSRDLEDATEDLSSDTVALTDGMRKLADINKQLADSSDTAKAALEGQAKAQRQLNEDTIIALLNTRSALTRQIPSFVNTTPSSRAAIRELNELDNALRNYLQTTANISSGVRAAIESIVGMKEPVDAAGGAIATLSEKVEENTGKTKTNADGVKKLTDDQKDALAQVDRLIASLQAESDSLDVAADAREAHDNVVRASNILTAEGLELDEIRKLNIQRLTAAVNMKTEAEAAAADRTTELNQFIEENLTLEEQRDKKIKEARDNLEDLVDMLGNRAAAEKLVENAVKSANKEYDEQKKRLEQTTESIRDASDVIEDELTQALNRNIETWADLRTAALQAIKDIIIGLLELEFKQNTSSKGFGKFADLISGLFDFGGSATAVKPVTTAAAMSDIGRFPGLQHGGRARAGEPVIVGEAGPELFIPDLSGTVVPNITDTGRLALLDRGEIVDGGARGDININYNGPTNRDSVEASLPHQRRVLRQFIAGAGDRD